MGDDVGASDDPATGDPTTGTPPEDAPEDDTAANDTPVLIYAPGIGRYPDNSADAIADVLARTKDRLDPEATFGTKTDPSVSAPRGLKVAKTIVNGDDAPVLQLFELDYYPALEQPSTVEGAPVAPGLVRSAAYAILATWKWIRAVRRPSKARRTKLQLAIGLAAALSLIFAALVAVYAALVAIGLDIPGSGVFGETAATWVFGVSSLGVTITWAAARNHVLALAATTQRLIRFVRNQDTTADSTSIVLDEALDGLALNEWKGKIHLLGYSFGSLVLYEAMFPRRTSSREKAPVARVASLTTIGCPLDMVRLYVPSFTHEREERRPGLPWTNVFNAADIFASNLLDGDDIGGHSGESKGRGARTPKSKIALDTAEEKISSRRYLDEELSLFRIASTGRVHAGYWGGPDRANCFEPLLATWV